MPIFFFIFRPFWHQPRFCWNDLPFFLSKLIMFYSTFIQGLHELEVPSDSKPAGFYPRRRLWTCNWLTCYLCHHFGSCLWSFLQSRLASQFFSKLGSHCLTFILPPLYFLSMKKVGISTFLFTSYQLWGRNINHWK